jgi:peptidoglycan/xylan/chitin deacetylase (PgdA/CDA1 family)
MKLLAINHHYVRDIQSGEGIYPTSSKQLESNVNKLLKKGWKPVKQKDLASLFSNQSDEKYFIFTFDDGLRCSYENGFTTLEKLFIPAIFFIPACILEQRSLFVHKLHYVRSHVDDKILLKEIYDFFNIPMDFMFNEVVLKKQYRYDNFEASRVKYLLNFVLSKYEEKRNQFIDKILIQLISMEEFIKETYMDAEMVKSIGSKGMIGTHGYNHLPMAQLSYNDLNDEINNSLNILNGVVGKKITSVSYPYGGPTAVSTQVFDVCKQAGLSVGFTMNRGVNTEVSNPLALDRIDVNDLDNFINA